MPRPQERILHKKTRKFGGLPTDVPHTNRFRYVRDETWIFVKMLLVPKDNVDIGREIYISTICVLIKHGRGTKKPHLRVMISQMAL